MIGVILFDIDNTLLNLSKIRLMYIQNWLKPNLILNNILSLCFVLFHFPKLEKWVSNSYLGKAKFTKSVFPETKKILKRLSKYYSLGIFSQGLLKVQQKKLKNSGLDSFFDERYVFISTPKLSALNSIQKVLGLKRKMIFVDDRYDIAKEIAQKGYRVFLLNNNYPPHKNVNLTHIKSLEEIEKYLPT